MTFTIRGRMKELEARLEQAKASGIAWDLDKFVIQLEAKIEALKEAAEAVEGRIGELEKFKLGLHPNRARKYELKIEELTRLLRGEGKL